MSAANDDAHTSRLDSLSSIRQASAWARALLDDSLTGPDHRAPGPLRRRRAGDRYDALVHRDVITSGQLIRARSVRDRTGGSLIEILTSWESVDGQALARALARESGLRYLGATEVSVVDDLVNRIDRRAAVRHQFAPVGHGPLGTLVVVADPFDARVVAIVHEHIRGPVEIAIASAATISELLNAAFGADSARSAVTRLRDSNPDDSASVVLTGAQKLFGATTLGVTAVALALVTIPTLIVLNALASLFYLASSLFRIRLIQLATDPSRASADSALAPVELNESELPIYTILVPMYREAAVVGRVVQSLSRLDYPAHKLDVLLICEADDDETIGAIREMQLGSQYRLIVVPDSQPKTKPKACNYALDYARGSMVVIFDAEDDPDPDQLRRVLMVLDQADEDVACVQARLGYANAEQNLLTRFFTVEYMMWFDLILPGLERIDAPIPLGGTSNHFRTQVLRELDGWDPFNVTEDADLGIRLYKRGYRTLNIDSTTMEEANSRVGNWIRQRSRWMKGHIQTWLVHNRNPIRTRRQLGWRGWLSFQLTIGGNAVAALLNPIYWSLVIIWFATRLGLLQASMPSALYYVASINLLVWNFLFVYANSIGVGRRRATHLVRFALLSPLYWVLISIAAWKGAIQLITKPFYWEKTIHGLDG